MRACRLIVAALLIAPAALFSYVLALSWNGDRTVIDANGSALGVLLMLAAVFGVSRIADDSSWPERAGTAIALASAYFMLTWSVYGNATRSPDDSPHLIWFGLCVAAFTPTVIIIPASKWAWSTYRAQRVAADL